MLYYLIASNYILRNHSHCLRSIPPLKMEKLSELLLLEEKDHCDKLEKILKEVFKTMHEEKDTLQYCQGFITLARVARVQYFMEELRKVEGFSQLCEYIKFNSTDTNVLFFCKAVFVSSITCHSLSEDEANFLQSVLEDYLKAINSAKCSNSSAAYRYDMPLKMLPKALQKGALQSCERFAPCALFDASDINVSFLCLKSLLNISTDIFDWQNADFFCTNVVFELLEKFHQLLMAPLFSSAFNLTTAKGSYDFQLVTIQQCFYLFEVILQQNPSKQAAVLNYKHNLYLKCMCRLLSYCMKALFKRKDEKVQSADDLDFEKQISVVSKHVYLHQSCLISALKVLLTFHPNYGTNAHEVTSALMGKLLICFLETSYSTLDCKFELCLMALELMVNLTEFEVVDRKQFAKLCLMKFNIGNSTYLSVEIFIKVLICSLKRIIDLGSLKKPEDIDAVRPGNAANAYHVAEEHMEHSFICSYICVYLSYFCDMKQQFFMYVCERLPVEMAEAAVIIMRKFKDFIPLMGKQNAQAFSMLDRAICIFLLMVKQSTVILTSCEELNLA